ncbi:MAG TPA: hypothetical protein VF490_07900 [Chryseosolibacter sp.]
MKDMEREKFEESCKSAFENAGVTPSEAVWVNVELELEKAKGGHLKKRLMFYQMLAAASVVFAMAVAGAGIYYNFNQHTPPSGKLALQNTNSNEAVAGSDSETRINNELLEDSGTSSSRPPDANSADQSFQSNSPAVKNGPNQSPSHQSRSVQAGDKVQNAQEGRRGADGESIITAPGGLYTQGAALPTAINDRNLPPIYTPRHIEVNMRPAQEEVDPVVAMMARLEREEREMRGEQKNNKDEATLSEKLWTSVGFAAGSFNTVQSSGSGPALSGSAMTFAAAPIVDQEAKASGYVYSMGLNVGTKLSGRWVLQGGVNYLTNSSDYTANNVVVTSTGTTQQRFRAASTNEIIHTDAQDLNNKILFSAPYNVNNSMRYLSVPMQAGYLLVDKTFGLQLNAGVATDLFLQNTVTPDAVNLDKTTQPGGADSPYRTVNVSGLFGTEFSYRFAEHYRVSLNPGIRYPFGSIYKPELGVQASPFTFDVGLRFRYIFH